MHMADPTSTDPHPDSPAPVRKAMSPLKIIVQVIGFAIGVALLAWCIRVAASDENRPARERIMNADWHMIALLLGLCVGSLITNGTLFAVVIRPLFKVETLGTIATNALATFLNNFPFKLSIASRFFIHNRRDGLPLLTIMAWIGATGLVIVSVLTPPLVATALHSKVDSLWWAITSGLLVAAFLTVLAISRFLGGRTGTARLASLAERVAPAKAVTVIRSKGFERAVSGLTMLASPRALALGMLCRIVDAVLIAARFAIAGKIAGVPTTFESLVLASSLYFLIGAVTPSGALGARDGGTYGALKYLPAAGAIQSEFTVVILTVTAAEFLVNLGAAVFSALYLRFAPKHPAIPVDDTA
jgi:hypothetical protein